LLVLAADKSVLIVEDDRFQAQLLKMMLTNMNYKVVAITETGERAVEMTSVLLPDFIFMEIALACEIDGIEAVRRIKEINSFSKIIYVSGNSDTAHIKRAEEFGFDDYLVKPINKTILTDSLGKVFS